MNAPPGKPLSKGMAMIAAFREERLSKRPVPRSTLQASHVARPAARNGEPVQPIIAAIAPPLAIVAEPLTIEAAPVIAGLVSTAAVEPQNETSGMQDLEARPMAGAQPPVLDDPSVSSSSADAVDAGAVDPGAVDAGAETAEGADARDVHGEPEAQAAGAPEPPCDPPLAEIGFGPGMLIRLGQIGLHTTRDLAEADAAQLRWDLGDISRLVDVDAWIRSARQTSAPPRTHADRSA